MTPIYTSRIEKTDDGAYKIADFSLFLRLKTTAPNTEHYDRTNQTPPPACILQQQGIECTCHSDGCRPIIINLLQSAYIALDMRSYRTFIVYCLLAMAVD